MVKVSVIIVNYNTKDTLRECLTNLLKDVSPYEIIVCDNASSDGSVAMVKESFSQVKLVELPTNRGIAFAANRGFEVVTGEYILYLGSDAFPTHEDLTELTSFMESNKDVGLITPMLITKNGAIDMDAHRGFPTPFAALTHFTQLGKLFPKSRIFNKYYLGFKDFSSPHEIDACISHFMLSKKAVISKIGGWDEDFFVYGEDIDLCFRVKQAGYKIMYLPQVKVLHLKGISVGVRSTTKSMTTATLETKLAMKKASVEAMELFYNKHYSTKYPKVLNLTVLTGIKILSVFRLYLFKLKNH